MSEQTQAGGVPQNGIAANPSGAGQAATPAAPGASGANAGGDLTANPDFREFQRKFDQREAELRKQNADLQAALAAQKQAEEQRKAQEFSALAPEEQVRLLLQERQREAQARAQAEAQQTISQRAFATVQAAGLNWNDPRLAAAQAYGPSQQGLDAITQSVIEIQRQEREALTAASKTLAAGQNAQSAANADAAAVQALNAAGVTRVPTGSTGTVIGTDIDPKTKALREQFYTNVRGKGLDSPEFRQWVDACIEAGVPLDSVR